MDRESVPVSSGSQAVRLHILSWPSEASAPSAVWMVDLSDVDWRPPEGWRSEIERTVSVPGEVVTSQGEENSDGPVLDIVARTTKGTAQVIADRHQALSLIEDWAQPREGSSARGRDLSEATARDAVLLVLRSHFGVDVGATDSVAVDFEPGDEWLVHVSVGTSRYVGTVGRQGRAQVSHVVHQTDATTDQGGEGVD